MNGAGDLNLEIDYRHESAGWIDCYLTFDGICHKLWASDVFPPFIQLIHWMRALTANRLPYRFYWDEEGHGAKFKAWPVAEDSPNFHITIYYDKDDTTWVDAELERKAVVDVLLAALRDYALYGGPPSRGGWDFSLADVIAFEEFQRRVIPPRSDHHSAEPIQLTLRRARQFELACQWLDMQVWGIPVVTMVLPDSHPMWPSWFEWLEKILLGQLPAEVDFLNLTIEDLNREMVARGEQPESVLDRPWGYTLRATAVDHPGHFRLVITNADDEYRDYLQLDEVQDRRAFVSAFCAEFERMLKEEYQVLADDDGTVFDLHSLPIEPLKTLLAKGNHE
jgi:hypothetical protein